MQYPTLTALKDKLVDHQRSILSPKEMQGQRSEGMTSRFNILMGEVHVVLLIILASTPTTGILLQHGFAYERIGTLAFVKSHTIVRRRVDISNIVEGMEQINEVHNQLFQQCGQQKDASFRKVVSSPNAFPHPDKARAFCNSVSQGSDQYKLAEFRGPESKESLANVMTSENMTQTWLNAKVRGGWGREIWLQWCSDQTRFPLPNNTAIGYRFVNENQKQKSINLMTRKVKYPLGSGFMYVSSRDQLLGITPQALKLQSDPKFNNSARAICILDGNILQDQGRSVGTICRSYLRKWERITQHLVDRLTAVYTQISPEVIEFDPEDPDIKPLSKRDQHQIGKKLKTQTSLNSADKPHPRQKRLALGLFSLIGTVLKGAAEAYAQARIVKTLSDHDKAISTLTINQEALSRGHTALKDTVERFKTAVLTHLQLEAIYNRLNVKAETVHVLLESAITDLSSLVDKASEGFASAIILPPRTLRALAKEALTVRDKLGNDYRLMATNISSATKSGINITTTIPGYELSDHTIWRIYALPDMDEMIIPQLEYRFMAINEDGDNYIPISKGTLEKCLTLGMRTTCHTHFRPTSRMWCSAKILP